METRTILVSVVLAFGLSALAVKIVLRGDRSASDGPRPAVTVTVGPGYATALADLDKSIDFLQKRASQRPDDWLIRSYLGNSLFERASLTHRIADYDRVQAVLDEAFALVPERTGPLVLAARYNFSLHRLAAAEPFLDEIESRPFPLKDEALAALVLRAGIALERGQYDIALDGFTKARATAPGVATAELALYHAKTGDPDMAVSLLEEALSVAPKKDNQRKAWLKLQLGLVAKHRGDLRLALRHLRAADADFSGWWLVQEHIADIHKLRGEHAEAIAIYEELVRTVDLPEHMDALAALYIHAGDAAKADELIARAGARWDELFAHYPESAMGHALQHHLQFGTPERALELALANHKLRPGGEAEVALGRAHLKAGQPAEALAVAERALATPYRSAGLHDLAAKAHAALGHTAAAEEQTALCFAINPMYAADEHTH